MNKITTLIIIVLLMACSSNAQQYLIKKDGSLLGYNELRNSNEELEVRLPGMVEFTPINRDEVDAYFDASKGKIYYMIAGEFMELVEEGPIYGYKLISREVGAHKMGDQMSTIDGNGKKMANSESGRMTNATLQYDQNVTLLFLEKDDRFYEVVGEGRDENMVELDKIFRDDQINLEKLESPFFANKYGNVLKMVEEYNMRHYQPSEGNGKTGKVTFYRKKGGQSDEPLKLMINDQEYSIKEKERITVDLPIKGPAKVCIGETCDLIGGFPSFERFFMLSLSKKGKSEIKLVVK